MTRDPMRNVEGPVVFAEHPARNATAYRTLARLRSYARASLLPAHGEPWVGDGALGRALDQARVL